MMFNNSPKNNNPKLEWWHKGALVGLGIGLVTSYFVVVVAASRTYFAGAGIFGLLLELPVLPIFLLVGFFLEGLSLYFGNTIALIVIHFISWILGGIVYAYIFRLLAKQFQKNKKQAGFALPIVILIVVILIVAGGTGYYFYKISQELEEIGEGMVDETVDWEIYRNEYSYEEDYWGYEIKYPPDWIMTEYKDVHQAKWTSPGIMTQPLREIFIETNGAFRHGGFYIDTINCTWSERQKEWFEKYPETESKTYPFPIGKEKIGELEFCRMQDIGGDEIGKIGGLGIRYVIFKNGWDYKNTLWVYYDISEDYRPSEDEFRYELDVFKKMLSTFKFLD